ncbi:hypothetical protein BC834DRAFT_845475 [Gloeopeniophorella convolvens]|nr:hypothetical protein BC834DRAFT_845475 [Gloeopeniophorella convolvens]
MPSLAALYFADIVSIAGFFGAYAVLTAVALYLLLRRERTTVRIAMTLVTAAMFGVSTVYFVLDIVLVADGLLRRDKHPETVIDLWGRVATAQIVCQGINSVLGDGIVIWRAWVVWGRRLRVVLVPLVLLFGVAFSSFGMAYAQSRVRADARAQHLFAKFMITLPSMTLATNLSATALILWRIGKLHVSLRGAGVSAGTVRYRRLLAVLIESGGLYCFTWALLLCFTLTGAEASHVCLGIISQLTGIYPTLIVVLVSLNLTQDAVHAGAAPGADMAQRATTLRFGANPSSTLAHGSTVLSIALPRRSRGSLYAPDDVGVVEDGECAREGRAATPDCRSKSDLDVVKGYGVPCSDGECEV